MWKIIMRIPDIGLEEIFIRGFRDDPKGARHKAEAYGNMISGSGTSVIICVWIEDD